MKNLKFESVDKSAKIHPKNYRQKFALSKKEYTTQFSVTFSLITFPHEFFLTFQRIRNPHQNLRFWIAIAIMKKKKFGRGSY